MVWLVHSSRRIYATWRWWGPKGPSGLAEKGAGLEPGLIPPHPTCPQVLARVFSRSALERFVPRLQGALRREVRSWCATGAPVVVYQAAKALTFRMAALILLGLRLDEAQCAELTRTFEQLVGNLFSLPLDVPFSGLRKVTTPLSHAAWGSQGGRSPLPEERREAWPRRGKRLEGLAAVLIRCVTCCGSHTLSEFLQLGFAQLLGFGSWAGVWPVRLKPSPKRLLWAQPTIPGWNFQRTAELVVGLGVRGRRHALGPAWRQPWLKGAGCRLARGSG